MREIDVIQEMKNAQERLGIKRGDMATRLDLSSPTVSRIISGMQPITVNVAARLARAGVGTIEEILHYQYRKDCKHGAKLKTPVKKNCLK